MNMHQNFIEQLREEVAKYEGRAGVPIEISNGFAEGLLEQIEAAKAEELREVLAWSGEKRPLIALRDLEYHIEKRADELEGKS